MGVAKTGAALPLETADASGVAVDDQVAVLAAHQVAKETAALTEQIDELKAENATLKTENAGLKDKVEIAEAAKAAAEKAFGDHKTAEAAKVELAKLAEARKAEVAKVAPALEATEDRLARWGAMDEAEFAAYLAEIASVAGVAPETFVGESAMDRKTKTAFTGKSAGRSVLGLS